MSNDVSGTKPQHIAEPSVDESTAVSSSATLPDVQPTLVRHIDIPTIHSFDVTIPIDFKAPKCFNPRHINTVCGRCHQYRHMVAIVGSDTQSKYYICQPCLASLIAKRCAFNAYQPVPLTILVFMLVAILWLVSAPTVPVQADWLNDVVVSIGSPADTLAGGGTVQDAYVSSSASGLYPFSTTTATYQTNFNAYHIFGQLAINSTDAVTTLQYLGSQQLSPSSDRGLFGGVIRGYDETWASPIGGLGGWGTDYNSVRNWYLWDLNYANSPTHAFGGQCYVRQPVGGVLGITDIIYSGVLGFKPGGTVMFESSVQFIAFASGTTLDQFSTAPGIPQPILLHSEKGRCLHNATTGVVCNYPDSYNFVPLNGFSSGEYVKWNPVSLCPIVLVETSLGIQGIYGPGGLWHLTATSGNVTDASDAGGVIDLYFDNVSSLSNIAAPPNATVFLENPLLAVTVASVAIGTAIEIAGAAEPIPVTLTGNTTNSSMSVTVINFPDYAIGPEYQGNPLSFMWANFSANGTYTGPTLCAIDTDCPLFNYSASANNTCCVRDVCVFNSTYWGNCSNAGISVGMAYDMLFSEVVDNSYEPSWTEKIASLFVSAQRKPWRDMKNKYKNERPHYGTDLTRYGIERNPGPQDQLAAHVMDNDLFSNYYTDLLDVKGEPIQHVFAFFMFGKPLSNTIFEGVHVEQAENNDRGDRKKVLGKQRRKDDNDAEEQKPRKRRDHGQPSQDNAERRIMDKILDADSPWHTMLLIMFRNTQYKAQFYRNVRYKLKILDDGSWQAGVVCLLLSSLNFGRIDVLKMLMLRDPRVLRLERFDVPMLNDVITSQPPGWDEVSALHLQKRLVDLTTEGVEPNPGPVALGTVTNFITSMLPRGYGPVHKTVMFFDAENPATPEFIQWVKHMTQADCYYMVNSKYIPNNDKLWLYLASLMSGLVRVEAHGRILGGMMAGSTDDNVIGINNNVNAMPTPPASGNNLSGASDGKDGVSKESAGDKPAAESTAVKVFNNMVTDTANWNKSMFQTTVNNVGDMLYRFAQSIKVVATKWNNTGKQSVMSWYESYFSNFMVLNDPEGAGVSVVNTYTAVDPSGPGNTTLRYTEAGADLATAIAENKMISVSQSIRIVTVPVNGVALYMAMTDSKNILSAGMSGSFASIFFRIFAYMYSLIPMVGTEHGNVVANTHIVLPNPITATYTGNYYALSSNASTPRPAVRALICTYTEYTAARFNAKPFNAPAQFGPSTWGESCAVVPVTIDMLNGERGDVLAGLIAAHLEHPWRRVSFATTMQTDDGTAVASWPGSSIPGICNARCRGPTGYVLLVVCGINTTANYPQNLTAVVGTGANAVIVSLERNNAVGTPPVGGGPIDIGPGIDTIFDTTTSCLQTWLEVLNQCYTFFGNEWDIRTALYAVADCGHRVAPPAVTNAGKNTWGYYNPGGTISWPVTDLFSIQNGALTYPLDTSGITCPLTMRTTSTLTDVQGLKNVMLRIGQLNPVIEIDLINGMYTPTLRPSTAFPQSTAAVASSIRQIARYMTIFGDQMIRMIGLPMNFLFSPESTRAISAGNVNIQSAWKAMYSGVNALMQDQCGAGIAYLPAMMYGFNQKYWTNFNTTYTMSVATGRVPNSYCKKAGLEWDAYSPAKNLTMTFGPVDTALFGYPNAGNPYERITTLPAEPSIHIDPYDVISRLSPMFAPYAERDILAPLIMTAGGGSVTALGWGNMYPSVGINQAIVLKNWGAVTYTALNAVDPPLDSDVPIMDPDINNIIYVGFAQTSYGYYTRAPIVKYNKHEYLDVYADTILQPVDGLPLYQARLMALSKKSSGAATDDSKK